MGKKIVITFDAQPVVGTGINYTIQVNGLSLVYPNGKSFFAVDFQATGGVDAAKIEIQTTLSNTINATLSFLISNYSTAEITYARVNNTIEVSINIDQTVLVYIGSTNTNISVDTVDVSNITLVNLKY